jgi:hypothetical protein
VLLLTVALALQPQKLIMHAYLPGQREVIEGVGTAYPDTMMQVILQKDMPPAFPAGGGTVQGGGLFEKALGWIRWSVKPDTFADQACFQLKCEGQLTEKLSKTASITLQDTHSYWVTADGTILRQFDRQVSPLYNRTANAVYHKDSIDLSVEDENGRRSSTAYPNVDMKELNAQFTPMMKGDTVLSREKTYYVFNPFTGKCDKYTARISGAAGGEYFNLKFSGKAFEIAGPELTQTAAISNEGDLILVELPKDRFIVMQQVPFGKQGAR